jgi:hypothetical protein
MHALKQASGSDGFVVPPEVPELDAPEVPELLKPDVPDDPELPGPFGPFFVGPADESSSSSPRPSLGAGAVGAFVAGFFADEEAAGFFEVTSFSDGGENESTVGELHPNAATTPTRVSDMATVRDVSVFMRGRSSSPP